MDELAYTHPWLSKFRNRLRSVATRRRHAVVAVPQRDGLLYGPAADEDAVAALRFSATAIYASSARSRVSSALYLFHSGHWTVFQPPLVLDDVSTEP